MDAIDILGSMLGRKTGSGGSGPNIFRDILTGGRSRPTRTPPTQSRRPPSRRDADPDYIESEADRLEDMLNVANERHTSRRSSPPRQPQQPPVSRAPSSDRSRGFERTQSPFPPAEPAEMNDQALILVRAMVNAAKSDGRVSRDEQEGILKEMDSASHDAIQFLRDEFAQPLDVKEFCWSVPLGMEQQVYTISLMAIRLDSQAEANYLKELSHGLRIPPHVCEQIHQRYGAPTLQ